MTQDIKKFDLLPDIINNKKISGGIVYISANGISGYANAAKGYIFDLIMSNKYIKWIPFNLTSWTPINLIDDINTETNTKFDQFLNVKKETIIDVPETIIIHYFPTMWDHMLNVSGVTYTNNTKIVGRTVWEFNLLQPEIVKSINNSKVTEVSVPTQWNKDIFIKCGVTKPIVVEPHIFSNYEYKKYSFEHFYYLDYKLNKEQHPLSRLENCYKFYCISQFNERKGIHDTVNSYCKAFTSSDNVLLILKVTTPDKEYSRKYVELIQSFYENCPPILYIDQELSFDEINSLHNISNCYFSLTRSEGFGLGIFDAFNHKKDIIVTGYSGYVEYLGDKHPGYVDYNLVEVPDTFSPVKNLKFNKNYVWAQADIEHASDLLRSKINKSLLSITIKEETNNLSILYVGQYGTSGYATSAKQYIADFILRDIPICWEPLYFDSSKLDNENYVNVLANSAIGKKIQYNTIILHCTPDLWPKYIKNNKHKIEGKYIIGYTVWETSKLNPEWVYCMNNSVDEIHCPSIYNKEVFLSSGITKPVKVVPHLFFKANLPSKDKIKIRTAMPDHYTFYNISELNERKNIIDLLECYCQEFTKKDKVQLILKLHYKDYTDKHISYCISVINKIVSKYKNRNRIVVITDNITEKQLLALHSYGDCYISLTRSEGFGLSVFDAFNYKKDIIITGYSGYIDYLGSNYKGLIDYKLIDVNGMDSFNSNYKHEGHLWASPDLTHAKTLMRSFYNNKMS